MIASCFSSAPVRRSVCIFTVFVGLLFASLVALAANFPPLTGRIVDQANVIPVDTRNAIQAKLADLEAKSGIQLVVATVTSLEGEEIEPYANDLFRNWKLGEKTKNNGVLLLVAPNERRVRIEVGYGLEGTLTDALSNVIIANAIVPRLKVGDFGGGISRGVDDIISVLTTDAPEWQRRPSIRLDDQQTADPMNWLLIAGLIGLVTMLIVSPGFRWFFLNLALNILLNSGGSRGGGGFSGGGFSGGGGSSGGGDASGSW
ncbi:MAG: TPM domain-containing protein [Xanthobacteraceae bacterium]